MTKRGRPSKGMTLTKHNIELAIKSTQSMGQAYRYMGVSRNTFKKYAKLHGLWKPTKNLKGIRRTGNVGSQLKHDIKEILEGKNPNPYRESTLLTKAIHEGYIACKCGNCDADFTHINHREPPLILDFNCVYELAPLKNGWYRHRNTPIGKALDEANTDEPAREIPKDDNLSYIPFEEFQKSLNN